MLTVINLFGAPSSGKSTVASGLFYLMKINKMSVELVTEFAKDLHLEGREIIFGDQNYIFAEQTRRVRRIEGNYEFAVTDSPILLPAFYEKDKHLPSFNSLVMEEFDRYRNFNYFLSRNHSFETNGRRHNETQALAIDLDLRDFLTANGVAFTEMDAIPRTPEKILEDIRRRTDRHDKIGFKGIDDPKMT